MGGVKIRLWLIRETEKARLYSKTPPERLPDYIWIAKSIVEHTSKRGNEHEVTLPDWFIEMKHL